jgi:hypothetical protein
VRFIVQNLCRKSITMKSYYLLDGPVAVEYIVDPIRSPSS